MDVIIRQSAGLGDIFFCQKIGKKIAEAGHTVYWPIFSEYQYAENYIESPFLWREPDHKCTEIPLECATKYLIWRSNGECLDNIMQAKYKLANSTFQVGGWEDWQDYLKIKRDIDEEERLKSLVLGGSNEPYCVTCKHFATNYMELKEPIISGMREIEIKKIEGFNLFDWIGVICGAAEIRIPDSSFPYLVEILPTTDRLYMYNRSGEPHIRTKPIWKKKWNFIEPEAK